MLVALSGPSGVGKDTLLRGLKRRISDISYVVTMTTRAIRPGEVEGSSYHFVSQEHYNALLDDRELLAPAQVHGHWYGVPAESVRSPLRHGQDVMMKIDVQGAMTLRQRIPQAVFVFLAPSSIDDLLWRLRARHTESPDELERRLRDARFEMAQLPSYDYVVVNAPGGLRRAVDSVACIIAAERLRVRRPVIELAQEN